MKKLILASSCLILSLLTNHANAGVIYWDPEGTFSYTTLPDGYAGSLSQTFENSEWSKSSAGTATKIAFLNDVGAVFSVGSGVNTPAFTITMNATHTIAGFFDGALSPNSSQVTLTGTGTAVMESVNLNGFAVHNSSDGSLGTMIFDVAIAGDSTAGIAAEDSGQVYLNAANTYSGGTFLGYINWNITSSGAKASFATIWNFNNNNSFGASNVYLLYCGGGALVAEGSGTSATINITNELVNLEPATNSSYINNGVNFAGNYGQLNFVGLPFTNGGLVWSGNWILSGGISRSGSDGYAPSAPLTSYAPLIFLSTGPRTYGTPLVNIAGQITGTNTVQWGTTSANGGTNIFMLSANNPFSGNMFVASGTLMLSNNGAINNVGLLTIGTNATFDVTNLANWTLSSNTMLIANGNASGQISPQGGGAIQVPTINGAANLGASPINLIYNGDYNDSILNITNTQNQTASLTLNGNSITVNNTTGEALPASPMYYYLITSGGSWNDNASIIPGGTISGSPNGNIVIYTNYAVGGGALGAANGLAPGYTGVSISVEGVVAMQVNTAPSTTTTTLDAPSAINYGQAPSIKATVTPDPTQDPNGGGVVQFFLNGMPLGNAVPVVTAGFGTPSATYTNASPLLTPTGPNLITAVFSGSGDASGSEYQPSAATAVSQTVNPAPPTEITWPNPAAITYGTPLSAIQLNASANTSGSFAYTPAPGTVLNAGTDTLSVIFTPSYNMYYSSATDTVSLVVSPAPLTVTANNTNRMYGETNPVFTGAIVGLANQDNITATYSCVATPSSPPGTYPIVPTLVDPDNRLGNYTVTTNSGVLDVTFVMVNVNGQPDTSTLTAVASAEVTFSGGYEDGFMFYTLDGSTPTESSTLYDGAFSLTNTAVVSVLAVSSDFSQSTLSTPVTVQIIPAYNLQTSVSGDGTVSLNPAGGTYASNTVVTLTANAATYWAFGYWTGGATGSQNPINVTMNGPVNVQAVFTPTAYPLTASTAGGGSVTVNGQVIAPNTYYPASNVVTLNATASNGWSFLGWQGNASGTNNPLNVTMNQTNNIQAVFATVVATNPVGGGSIVFNQPNPIPYGTTLTASAVPNAGNYFVTWSGAASGTNAPTTVLVTNANPAIDALFTTLPGGEYSLAVVVGGEGSVAISPQQNYYNPGSSVTLSASTTNAGTGFYGWTGNASGTNNPLLVTINSNMVVEANFGGVLPTVEITPQNQIVLAGSNAVLTAYAAGYPPLSYQWQNSQGPMAGQTNATFEIIDAQATNADSYTVVVSNSYGSVTSVVATVTVVFPPSISAQPMPQTVEAGSSLTLSVSASGTAPLSYQWEISEGLIDGATNSSYTVNPALTNYTDNYWVVISNAYGVVTSQVAAVVVYAPVAILSGPNSLVAPATGSATFAVTASGYPPPIMYQWTLNGTNLAGATSNTLTIGDVELANLGNYQVLVSNAYSSTSSSIATLNMSPSITAPFLGATPIWGQSATFIVGAIGSGTLTYQWYFNGQPIPGANYPQLNFNSIQFTNNGFYSVVISSPYGSVTNVAEQVSVNPADVTLEFSPTLNITAAVGDSYIIQRSADLSDTNNWMTLGPLTLTQPQEKWVDTSVDASSPFNNKYFYRLVPQQ